MADDQSKSNWRHLNRENGIVEVQTDSWHGFVSFIQDELSNYRQYIFRGQREASWGLTPSLERLVPPGKTTNSLLEFKTASRGRRGPSPSNLSDNEWWTLGQHHGLKTPLLDWTESPFVAAFFAFSEKRDLKDLPKNRIVFALAKEGISSKTEEIKSLSSRDTLLGPNAIEIISPQVNDNGRLVSQRGLFTKSIYPCLDFEKWIRETFNDQKRGYLLKIFINESEGDRESFLIFLNRMNINYLSLFPDLDGAAKHCNMQLEIKDY